MTTPDETPSQLSTQITDLAISRIWRNSLAAPLLRRQPCEFATLGGFSPRRQMGRVQPLGSQEGADLTLSRAGPSPGRRCGGVGQGPATEDVGASRRNETGGAVEPLEADGADAADGEGRGALRRPRPRTPQNVDLDADADVVGEQD